MAFVSAYYKATATAVAAGILLALVFILSGEQLPALVWLAGIAWLAAGYAYTRDVKKELAARPKGKRSRS